MSLYAGLDMSVKTTALCVVNANGQVLLQMVVDSSPDVIAERLREFDQPIERIGLEAEPLSQWIYGGLVDIGLAAICVETRHMHAALSARINKTDRNDARAAVLGANDGIISTASLIVGVAAAAATQHDVMIAGVAGLVAVAMSMAAGEYVSVSSQSDTEQADVARERKELSENPDYELNELAEIYVKRGVDQNLARQVVQQLMAKRCLDRPRAR